jgi:hypothetical protein
MTQALALHLLENILTGDNLSEDNVPTIQVGCFHKLILSGHISHPPYSMILTYSDEELRTIGVGSSIRHRE